MDWGWLPRYRAKPSFEDEMESVYLEISEQPEGQAKVIPDRLDEIAISPYETLKAPRVGRDAEADAWVAEHFPKRKKSWLSFGPPDRDFGGCYVLDLVPACDGVPPPEFTGGTFGEYVDGLSFMASLLHDCSDVVDEDMVIDGMVPMEVPQFLAYGQRLRQAAEACAAKHKVDLSQPMDTEYYDSVEGQLAVVLAAAKWCVFWAERGHALEKYP